MKILRITSSMDPAFGGPPHGIRASIQALAGMGVENEVVCCDAPEAEWIGCDSFPLHALGPGRFGYSFSPRLLPWLKKNASRFDAVLVHGMWQWPGLALVYSRVPRFFLMPHGMLDPWFQADPSRRGKAVRNLFYWWIAERRVVNGAAGLFFTCQEEMRLAATTFGGYRPKRSMNIGYGIQSPPDFTENMRKAFLEKLPRVAGRHYLLFLGRIHPKKGVDLLVEAFLRSRENRSADWDLVIAGPGWDSAYGVEVKAWIGGDSRIHATGLLEGDSKWGAMHGCEAFVLPSHQENFGIAVAEALGCNKPVLISDKVNIWREIAADGAGLAAEDSTDGTAHLLHRFGRGDLIGANPQRFRDCFLRRFEIQQAARNFLEAVQTL